jgi:hypothetical protein
VGILANERQSELIMQVQKEGSIKLVLRGDHVDVDAEGSMDEEGIVGLGLSEAVHEETGPTIQNTGVQPLAQAPPRVQPSQQMTTKTMRIWNKDGVETVTFRDGVAIVPTPRAPNATAPAPAPAAAVESAAEEALELNSDDFTRRDNNDDRARGLDEDQY